MNDLLFSVIIDTFNYGSYVEDAIISARNQTFPRNLYEIIVVDDGSTDDTRERVSKYSDIIYLYKENGGQASAFNAGLALARGRYIAFLDADDYWSHEKLERVFQRFEMDASVDVVYHTLTIVDDRNSRGDLVASWFRHFQSDKPIENTVENTTVFGCVTSGIAWRMETLKSLLPIPKEYRICADGYLMMCGSLIIRKFALIDKPLAAYRIHGANGYAMLTPGDRTARAKSHELEMWYRSLLLRHLEQLSKKINRETSWVIRELDVACFSDEMLKIQSVSGTIKALQVLWKHRERLNHLSLKYRSYRQLVIMLRLILPAQLYARMQQAYGRSHLWLFVQRCIKNDSNFSKTQYPSETT